MLSIGHVALATNLLLAPMARISDAAFRLTVRVCGGVGLASTELLSARGILEKAPKTVAMAVTEPADHPLSLQLFGADAGELAEAARWAQDHGADVIDINMGCPVPKVVRRGAGAALLHRPADAVRLLEAVRRAVRIPVTAKFRLGWDAEHIVAPALAADLESAGADAVIVHGRTVDQQFTGHVQLDRIAHVVERVHTIPVIGNGDVRSPQEAAEMIARTGVAGVMIGRAAKRDPWIFRDTHAFLTTGQVPAAPSRSEWIRLIREHFEALCRLRGERVACALFRQRISWYMGRLRTPRPLRDRLRTVTDAGEFRRWMNLLEQNGGASETETDNASPTRHAARGFTRTS